MSLLKPENNLKKFINYKITGKIINEDLNFLLPAEKFKKIRKFLKPETPRFVEEEIKRLQSM